MTRKLQQALTDQKKQNEQVVQQIPGLLGIPLDGQRRVEVPNRQAFVFVRLRSNQSEVIQAYNNQVAPAYNLPVLVERHGGRYEVVGVDTARYENNWNSNAPFLPRHGNTHSFDLESGGGGDVVWVYPRQFMPALVIPSGSSGAGSVFVSPYTLQNSNGTWKYVGNTGTASLIQYNPTSSTGAIMGLVYLDAPSGNPYLLINSGTVFSNSITGSSQIYPYIPTVSSPSTQIPLAAIRLITGSNALSWDNIYDVRQWIHTTTTGSGGGGGSSIDTIGIAGQDEGVNVGTGTVLNVTGAGASLTRSGTVLNLSVPAVGSIDTGTLDARYLKLNTSNDPLYGGLIVSGSFSVVDDGSYSLFQRLENGSGGESDSIVEIDQLAVTNSAIENPALYIFRGINDSETPTYSGPAIKTDIVVGGGIVRGGVLLGKVNGTNRLELNPSATGTSYMLDTDHAHPAGGKLLSVKNFGVERMSVIENGTVNIASGTYNIGGVPHSHDTLAGTYTPTGTSASNLDSTPTLTEAQYMRVGNTVTVSGRFTADPTLTATATSFEITLPIASNLGAAEDCAGVAFCGTITAMGAEVLGSATNNTAVVKWVCSDINSNTWSYTFTYQVI